MSRRTKRSATGGGADRAPATSPTTTENTAKKPRRPRRKAIQIGFVVAGIVIAAWGVMAWAHRSAWQQFDQAIRNENPAEATARLTAAEKWNDVLPWGRWARVRFATARLDQLSGRSESALENLVWAENLGYDADAVGRLRALQMVRLGVDLDRLVAWSDPDRGTAGTSDELAAVVAGWEARGDDARSTRMLEIWTNAHPDDPRAWCEVARRAGLDDRLPYTLAPLAKALRCNPRHLPTRLGLAEASVGLSRFSDAVDHYRAAETLLDPFVDLSDRGAVGRNELLNAKAQRVAILADLGDDDAAVELAETILAAVPLHFGTAYQLAQLHQRHDRHDSAIAVVESLLGRFPEDISLHYLMATSRMCLGQRDLAQPWIARYLAGRRDLDRLTMLETRLREGVISSPPDRLAAYMELGETYLSVKWNEALPWLQRAEELAPGSATVSRAMAEFEVKNGP